MDYNQPVKKKIIACGLKRGKNGMEFEDVEVTIDCYPAREDDLCVHCQMEEYPDCKEWCPNMKD